MAWIEGTATDHRDMLDQVIEAATSDHVSVVAVTAGGTGHAVDDIITFTDGTFTHAATARVTSVAGGVIDGIQVENWGAYTADPTLVATTAWTTSGSGISATFALTMESDRWTMDRRAQEAVSAVIATAGTGYTVGDQLTITVDGGGVLGSTAYSGILGVLCVFNVDSITGGGGTGPVNVLSLVTAGHLEETPDVGGGDEANTTGGTGTGATLTVTYQNVGATQEDVVVFNAPGEGGSDDIRMAIRTHSIPDGTGFDTVRNWQLFGLIEYNAALALHEQNNISPGMLPLTGARITTGAAYFVLKEDDADPDITFWLSITNRRMILVCKVETSGTTHYSSMYLGLLNAFSTAALEPYPMWVQGNTSRDNSHWGDTQIGRSTGLSDMYALSSGTLTNNGAGIGADGPAFYRADAGEWRAFRNSTISGDGTSPSRASVTDFTMWPAGQTTFSLTNTYEITTKDSVVGIIKRDIIPITGNPGTAVYKWRPTPNTGDDVRPLLPLSPLATDDPTSPTRDVYIPFGELDNCFWLSASDATTDLTSEDIQKDGEVRYIVFQNGNQTEEFNYFALKQE